MIAAEPWEYIFIGLLVVGIVLGAIWLFWNQ